MFELRAAAFASGESMYLARRQLLQSTAGVRPSRRGQRAPRLSFFLRRPVQIRASLCAPIVMEARR